MLYIKGKVNSVTYKEPEDKKPFYNVQIAEKGGNGSIFTDWCKIYSAKKISIGDELEVQVKVNAWAKDKHQLIGFIK